MTEDTRQFHCETIRRMERVMSGHTHSTDNEMTYYTGRSMGDIFTAQELDRADKLNVYRPTSFEWQGYADD